MSKKTQCLICGQVVRKPDLQLDHQLCNMCWNLNRALPQNIAMLDQAITRIKEYRVRK